MQSLAMANRYVIGVDPDVDKHGVSFFRNGDLIKLEMLNTIDLLHITAGKGDMLFSIEDVMANQFVYSRNRQASKSAESKIAMRIGRCQQAQVELMRWLEHYGIKYVLHKPQKGNWADNRELFEKITGWKKQSNVDTRSAAYFGWLALQNNIKNNLQN